MLSSWFLNIFVRTPGNPREATGEEWLPLPLQYSCLENPMGGGVWQAAVHGVARSRTRLSDFTFAFHFHALEKEMATHSSVLAWRIPGTGEPSGLPSMGLHRVGHNWSNLTTTTTGYYRQLPNFQFYLKKPSLKPFLKLPTMPHTWERYTPLLHVPSDLKIKSMPALSIFSTCFSV